jgi:hypothetical protein
MRHAFKATLIGLGALGALATAPAAWAGCGQPSIQPATYQVGAGDAQLIRASSVTPANLGAIGIVGLWSFNFVPTAGPGDWGYQQWHSDGTEIMNSGGHSPASGNFCLGTWRQSGPNSYHLKHFPLAYNPATGALMFKIVVTEDVTIDATGNNFSGHQTLQFYDPTGTTLEMTQTGAVTGKRVLPN